MSEQQQSQSWQPQILDVIITGDWNLDDTTNRYAEGYAAKFDRTPSDWYAAQGIGGYPGDFYATPAVVEAIIARQDVLRADLIARHLPIDDEAFPTLVWDGQTLTHTMTGETDQAQLDEEVPGYVRLPAWNWGPEGVDLVDVVVEADGTRRSWGEPPAHPIGFEARCFTCGETYNPDGIEDTEHGERADGTECGGRGYLTGWWS